ncbi:MAG: M56 family metallopeptidase [Pseudohongiellaceae bacterium]
MIDLIGSFAAIWLAFWFSLSVLSVLLYPAVKRLLFNLHPRYGSSLLLGYWAAPFLLSLISTTLLFLPAVESLLVGSHCHAACDDHVPVAQSAFLTWLGLVLAGGMLSVCLYRLLSHIKASFDLRRQFGLLGNPRADYQLIDSREPLVFTLGWWRPEVFVSHGILDRCGGDEMDIVLTHEREHLRRRDNLRLLLARVFGILLPAALSNRLMDDLRLLTEEACDFQAAENFGEVRVAEVLLKMQKLLQERTFLPPGVAIAFGEREVEERIVALLGAAKRYRPSAGQLGSLWVALFLCLVFIVEPLHHSSEWLLQIIGG